MQITRIDLENVKSYRRESVTFTEGTNAICGPNGAGKSTLLEAIGFVLFGHRPFSSQSQLVREGEKTATITVHLVDDDGRPYQVVRRCGSSSQYCVYDPEIGKLTTKKGDTLAWLHECMGVEETDDLSALFRDAVGVPQGLLTAVFLEAPGKRKDTFNPLLRVDEYERVWKALLEPRRRLEESVHEQEKRIAGFQAEVKALPGLQEKAAGLQGKIESDEKDKGAAEAKLEAVARRKESLEAVKEQLDGLERSVARARADVKTLEAQLEEAQAAVERAEDARAVVAETEAGHQAYLAAQAALNELEAQRKERDRLNEVLRAHTTDLALARQEAEGLKSELETVAAAEADMEALRPQVEVQEQLEGELAESRSAASWLA